MMTDRDQTDDAGGGPDEPSIYFTCLKCDVNMVGDIGSHVCRP